MTGVVSEVGTKHPDRWHNASGGYHKAFRQLAQGTFWLANTPIASSLAVKAHLMSVVQNRFGIHPSYKAMEGRSIPKRRLFASFWDLPSPDSPPRHINPKTIWNNVGV